jgi:GH24 family phage-related lysozyme (muramidase)
MEQRTSYLEMLKILLPLYFFRRMRYIITLILVISFISINRSEVVYNKEADFSQVRDLQCYEKVIGFIKQHEGLLTVSSNKLDGFATIGHGCLIMFMDKPLFSVNEQQADSILRVQYNANLEVVKRLWPNLNYQQSCSVAHANFSLGLSTVLKYQLVKNGKLDIEATLSLSKWNGKFHYLMYSLRQFEVNLFYGR